MDKLHELYSKKLPDFKENDLQFEMKNKCHDYLKKFKTKDICKAVILLDDYDGLSNWDCCEADSLEEAIIRLQLPENNFERKSEKETLINTTYRYHLDDGQLIRKSFDLSSKTSN